MKHLAARVRVVLLLAFVPQVVASQEVLAQSQELQRGNKAHVVLLDPNARPLQGSVIETWDDGFEIEVGGESRPRRVDFAEVESLQRSVRLGTKWGKGALIGAAVLGLPGFLLGFCFDPYGVGCAGDFRTGTAVGLVAGQSGPRSAAGSACCSTTTGRGRPYRISEDRPVPIRTG